MITWPQIENPDAKTISQVALELALWSVAKGIREVGGNNRGPWPDYYAETVGLDPKGAYPWCTSALYCIFREAARQKRVNNPFPHTAKAVEVWNVVYNDPVLRACIDPNPAPGRIYLLDHGKAWASELGSGKRLTDNGHAGICSTVVDLSCGDEASANTNGAGSREGDRWAIHHGTPEVSHGGVLLGWIDLDRVQLHPV